MKNTNRLTAPLALAAALALPIATNGCSSDVTNPTAGLCCTDFKVGADLSGADFGVDASIKGQFSAFAQAAGDLSATATAALDDVTNACKAIVQAGGANADKEAEANTKKPADRVKFWCDLAVGRVKAKFSASGSLKVTVAAPKCSASFKAEANCQANCSVDASCDVKAKPPTCEGGKLEVSCSGSCDVSASAPSISCEGSCGGTCEGSCTAQGGVAVDCDGKCEGTCAAGGSASGSGAQADGSCKGTCQGTCTARAEAPKVACSGACKGQCNAKCSALPGQASVKCDGTCSAKAEPISCKGGELKAQCKADANCQANCKASASAKAECTPPQVEIVAAGTVDAEGAILIEALRLHLPDIFLVFQARGEAFVKLTAQVAGSASAVVDPGKLGVKGTACLGAIVPVMLAAGENIGAAFQASGSVAGSVGVK